MVAQDSTGIVDTRSIGVLGYRVTLGAGILNALGVICHRNAPAHRYAIITDA